MRTVLTGGDGFAGRWLCRALIADGCWVSAWVRRPPTRPISGVHYRVQDIRDSSGCAQAMNEDRPEQVFHLAALTHLATAEANPELAKETNVEGTIHVMRAVPAGARAVYASTCHVYGPPQQLPVDEHHQCEPQGIYAHSKLLGEEAARQACSEVVIARAFHHTGPGQSTRFALADWAQRLRSGLPVVTGDLSLRRDYTDVRDIVAGYRLLAKAGVAHQAYNLCSGEAPTLASLLAGLSPDGRVDHTQDPSRLRTSDIAESRGDPAKAEALGWTRAFSSSQMLRALAEGQTTGFTS
jgi:GDP-4-dehydro-6-deoxy-D-mannose reductase